LDAFAVAQRIFLQALSSLPALSTLRALPFVFLLIGAGWLWREEKLNAEAVQIMEGLNKERIRGANAAIALWKASPSMRVRVVDRLLNSRGRLRDAGTDWVPAYASLEPDSADDLVVRLVDHLNRPNLDGDTQRSLIQALGRVAGRLDAAGAAKAAADLRARLDRPNLNPSTQRSLIDALASLAMVPSHRPTPEKINGVRFALSSVAWPLRDPSKSPSWDRLETISGQKFDHDVQRLLIWAKKCCELREANSFRMRTAWRAAGSRAKAAARHGNRGRWRHNRGGISRRRGRNRPSEDVT
jgi:hypothetical protein